MAKPALDLSHLSVEEKLELIDDLWSSLGADDWPLTDEQRGELDRRLDRLDKDGPGKMVPWEALRAEMSRKGA